MRRLPPDWGAGGQWSTLVTISRISDRDSRDPESGDAGNAKATSSTLPEFRVISE